MNSIIKYIGKRLPIFIKEPLIQIYQKWNSKIIWDKERVKDLMEFFDLSYDETLCMLKTGTKQVHAYWYELNPESNEEIINFYKKVPSQHVFALAYWHMARGQIKFRKTIMKYCYGNVLDYGGGNWRLVRKTC